MCDFTKGFKLCTCHIADIQVDTGVFYIWQLYTQADFLEQNKVIGKFLPSQKDLGAGLTLERVLQNLNAQNCFDFEYNPTEGDCLRIRQVIHVKEKDLITLRLLPMYMTFIYTNGEWARNIRTKGEIIKEEIAEGQLIATK